MAGDNVTQVPRWMRITLYFAGLYNIVFGTIAIIAPSPTLESLGLMSPTPREAALWQCIGMIVGVYGIAYALAASDPFRHWPIVLVGLLGKVLGPVGFAFAAAQGATPWQMGFVLLPNDLLWWVPFALILVSVVRERSRPPHTT